MDVTVSVRWRRYRLVPRRLEHKGAEVRVEWFFEQRRHTRDAWAIWSSRARMGGSAFLVRGFEKARVQKRLVL